MSQIYTKTANFTSARALTEDEMRKLAPSIFAAAPHESRSARFVPVPTIEILREIQKEGFMPIGVRQSRCRMEGRRDFTKHEIRLRRIEDDHKVKVGDVVPEIRMLNANDGSSVCDFLAGLFRTCCLNGLVVNEGTIDSVKVKHIGRDVIGEVIEGTYRVMGAAKRALEAPAVWSQIQLAPDERQAFAAAARVIRFGDAEGEVKTGIKAERLLDTRRRDDESSDLWTTLNVVQENCIRGGLRGVTRDANNRRRRVTSRAINGIDQDIRLNKALWTLAEKMAELRK